MLKELFNLSNYYFNPYAVPVLIVGIITLFFGFTVFLKNSSGKKNKIFLLLSLSFFIWLFFAALNYFSNNAAVSNFWYKYFAYNGVLTIFLISYFFFIAWIRNPAKIQIRLGYIFSVLIGAVIFLNTTTKMVIPANRLHFYGYYPIFDNLGIISFFICVAIFLFEAVFMVSEYKKEQSLIAKNQIKLIITGFCFAIFASVDFLPAIFSFEIYTIGYLLIFIMFLIWMYAVIRYKAMEVETVIHKTFLWLLSSLAIIIPLFIIIYLFFGKFEYLSPVSKTIIALLLFYVFRWYNNKIQIFIDRIFRRRAYDYYEKLSAAVEEISTELDLNELIKKLTEKTRQILHPKKVEVLIKEDNAYVLRQYDESKIIISQLHPLFNIIEENRAPMEINDIKSNDYPDSVGKAEEWFKENEAVLVVPLSLKNKVIGVLVLGKRESLKPYRLADFELLERLGKQIGPALYNAIHHEALLKAFLGESQKLKNQK